jgi:hypothetical protein
MNHLRLQVIKSAPHNHSLWNFEQNDEKEKKARTREDEKKESKCVHVCKSFYALKTEIIIGFVFILEILRPLIAFN